MKKTLLITLLFLIILACKNGETQKEANEGNAAFENLLQAYNAGKLALDPLSATFSGQNSFNDKFLIFYPTSI
ncbi:hypothetical protein [Tenacibaculum sp. SG-28]|uniref:hypothetical protein n=1 Tax=Tenacibaculum sp. SG-28 TaxID=754426 RepID=UPI0026D96032